jgi:hypothetical protein
MRAEFRSDGVMEWWSSGVVEWWSGGVMEWWSSGVVEWWSEMRMTGLRGSMNKFPILQLLNSCNS